MDVLSERILKLRCDRNETQQQLADALNVKRETIRWWESGERQIKAGDVAQLARHFGVTSDYLLGLTNDPARQPSAVDDLGLTPHAVDTLRSITEHDNSHEQYSHPPRNEIISALFSDPSFPGLMLLCQTLLQEVDTAHAMIDNGNYEKIAMTSELVRLSEEIQKSVDAPVIALPLAYEIEITMSQITRVAIDIFRRITGYDFCREYAQKQDLEFDPFDIDHVWFHRPREA